PMTAIPTTVIIIRNFVAVFSVLFMSYAKTVSRIPVIIPAVTKMSPHGSYAIPGNTLLPLLAR
ncbi:MAG: hypothetical protein PHX93_04560, partial [Candidatus Peribacteraceae bacterium]|nr:hypothetical protein [Candidatus Peribacteraceae bacterium]